MNKKNSVTLILALCSIFGVSLGCAGMQKPWRSYTPKAFDAKGWQKGDAIERGTMTRYLLGVQNIRTEVGENKTAVIKTLGEPDSTREDKVGAGNMSDLLYEVDLGEPEFMYALQVFFDEDDKTMFATLGATKEKESIFNIKR